MALTTPVYVTRDTVKEAADVNETARNNRVIDDICESVTRQIEGELHRRFYPELTTRKFDWPNYQSAASHQLYLEGNELIEIVTLTVGGTVVAAGDYILRNAEDLSEPPYDLLEMDLAGSAALSSGDSYQQAIEILGLFGHSNAQTPAGTLNGNITSSATTLDTNAGAIDVGTVLTTDSERMLVTGKTMVDTTLNLLNTLTASKPEQVIQVTNGTLFAVDEVILIDAERMKIVDIAGNNLIVIRAWDGTTLAAHSITADIYVPRRLTVVRGLTGSTAASHLTAATMTAWKPPGLIGSYGLALALNDNRLRLAGYAPDSFSNKGLVEKAAAAYTTYGRKLRADAI